MLHHREKAFGFDGCLGHLDAKVHIRTVDGQVPISAPMYRASPEKRKIIEAQLDKWFEQGVIEPSKSPWSAPVVIAYHHGKPHFCMDYRKLNAATTPDEFPIPHQAEILQSLSGAQVLSSLDALLGFTQLELDHNDVEKITFHTQRLIPVPSHAFWAQKWTSNLSMCNAEYFSPLPMAILSGVY